MSLVVELPVVNYTKLLDVGRSFRSSATCHLHTPKARNPYIPTGFISSFYWTDSSWSITEKILPFQSSLPYRTFAGPGAPQHYEANTTFTEIQMPNSSYTCSKIRSTIHSPSASNASRSVSGHPTSLSSLEMRPKVLFQM